MNVYILQTKAYLLENISQQNSMQSLCTLIDSSFSDLPEWFHWHNTNEFKNYCFSGLTPIEPNKVYAEGQIYNFTIRTSDKKVALYLKEHLVNAHTKSLKVLTIETKIFPKIHLSKIYHLTPCIIKTDFGYWRDHLTLLEFEKRLKGNLFKKYQTLTGEKINEDFEFFTHLKFDNLKPISTSYKNIKLLGDKLTLTIADNPSAQKLAAIALSTGLGEMGSRGFGYCHYKYNA